MLPSFWESVLTEQNAVPLIVVSSARDPVEAINSILRRAGHPVHCTWIASLRDLGESITKVSPSCWCTSARTMNCFCHQHSRSGAPTVPVVVLADAVDEARIAAAMIAGARDAVTLSNPVRLQAVMVRELRAFRLERALTPL